MYGAHVTATPQLQRFADNLFVAEAPLYFLGLHVGTRMTVVCLGHGELFLHSPVPATPALRAEVDALGDVAYIVAPNIGHHMYAGEWASAYPQAQLYGSPTLPKRRKELRFAGTLEAQRVWPWEGELVTLPILGNYLEETAFVHVKSGTLITSDLVENFRVMPHLPTRLYLRANGILGQPGFSRMLRPLFRDKRAARASLDAVLEQDFEGVILAHGELLTEGGRDILRSSFDWLKVR